MKKVVKTIKYKREIQSLNSFYFILTWRLAWPALAAKSRSVLEHSSASAASQCKDRTREIRGAGEAAGAPSTSFASAFLPL